MNGDVVSQLESQRRYLVNDFLALITGGHKATQRGLSLFPVVRYNEIVKSIHQKLQDQALGIDPILVLPSEIWIECFLYLVIDDPDWVYTALSVCKRWWKTVLAVPTFWKYIGISPSEQDTPQKIATSIFLSRDLPLCILFRLTATSHEGMVNIQPLLAVNNRISEIAFEADNSSRTLLLRWMAGGFPFLSQFDTLSNLKSISMSSFSRLSFPSIRVSSFPSTLLPNLKVIRGYTATLRSIQSLALTEVEIECEPEELISYILEVLTPRSPAVQTTDLTPSLGDIRGIHSKMSPTQIINISPRFRYDQRSPNFVD
jgi:hypothetical protein